MSWVASIAASVAATGKVVSKISEDRKSKRAAKRVDQEKATEKADLEKKLQEQIAVAKGLVTEGDPLLAEKQRRIEKSAADATGKATATSKSTQEIINAAQATQVNKDSAENLALSQANEFKLKSKKFLAERFGAAGQLRLQGTSLINQEAAAALNAIAANAQANQDSVASTLDTGTQIGGVVGANRGGN